MERFLPIVKVVTAVFLIIELGLTAYVVSPWRSAPSSPSFMLFNSVWSLLVIGYLFLVPLFFASLFHGLAALVLEIITMIFWFAGSIALAAFIGDAVCGGSSWCGSAKAATAFGFFLWALFTFFVAIDTMAWLRNRNTAPSKPAPPVASVAPVGV
ncbi:hypothetical protein VTJ83DRAFT_3044 [Remersonia thermophila]|uniref:MARVEL domain-containing protein n=1 Tax=Remersonia thermophila TaxID=72144 RepID=A0ABR4DCX3_9PEZI